LCLEILIAGNEVGGNYF